MDAPAIGVLTLELHLSEAQSLKDKRHYLLGLKERLRHKYNVSASETAWHDLLNRGQITVVTVSPSRPRAEQVLKMCEADAVAFLGPFLESAEIEWLD